MLALEVVAGGRLPEGEQLAHGLGLLAGGGDAAEALSAETARAFSDQRSAFSPKWTSSTTSLAKSGPPWPRCCSSCWCCLRPSQYLRFFSRIAFHQAMQAKLVERPVIHYKPGGVR